MVKKFTLKNKKSELFKLTDNLSGGSTSVQHKIERYGEDIQVSINIDQIDTTNQVRQDFSEDKIQELANSITDQGLLYPIIVMKKPTATEPDQPERFTLLVGENRLRAFKLLEKTSIPARVKAYIEDENERRFLQLTENIYRKNLNPIELADGLMLFKKESELTLEDLSKKVGRSIDNLKKYSRIHNLDGEIKRQFILKKTSFNEIMKHIDKLSSQKSASKALPTTKKPFNPNTFIKSNKTSLTLPTLKINLKKETTEEIQAKLNACKLFIQRTEAAINTD